MLHSQCWRKEWILVTLGTGQSFREGELVWADAKWPSTSLTVEDTLFFSAQDVGPCRGLWETEALGPIVSKLPRPEFLKRYSREGEEEGMKEIWPKNNLTELHTLL